MVAALELKLLLQLLHLASRIDWSQENIGQAARAGSIHLWRTCSVTT